MAAARRRQLIRGRYLIRPCGLAGNRWEAAATGLYSLALGTIAGSEILTPDDALAALGLPLDAIWRLRRHRFSSRHSAVCVGPRRGSAQSHDHSVYRRGNAAPCDRRQDLCDQSGRDARGAW